MTKYRNDYQGITFIPKLDDEELPVGDLAPQRSWRTALVLLACYAATAAAGLVCVHSLTGWLVLGLAGPIELSPLLTNVVLDDRPRPLTADQERCVARILGEPDRSARAIPDWAMPVAASSNERSAAKITGE